MTVDTNYGNQTLGYWAASGGGDLPTPWVDASGYASISVIAAGTGGGTKKVKVEFSDVDTGTDPVNAKAADYRGIGDNTVGSDGKVGAATNSAIIDVQVIPTKRYVKATYDPGTGSPVSFVLLRGEMAYQKPTGDQI